MLDVKNKNRILGAIQRLLKKLHGFFFLKEFGVKKPKAFPRPGYPPQPTYISKQDYRPYQGQAPFVEQRPSGQEIPAGYNEDKIVLQVRDPWWLHSYWEVTQGTKDKLRGSLGDSYEQAAWALRVYDISFIIFNGSNAHRYFDIAVGPDTNNWYIQVSSGRSFCVDLGLRLKNGNFITVVRSNTVTTPLDGPSGILDEEWMILDDEFMRLYGVGFGGSSPDVKRRLRKFKEYISSWGFLSRLTKEK
jgi:hypothetical protein